MTETQAILRHALIAVGAAAAAMLAFGGPAVGVLGGAAGAIASVLLARRRGAEQAARRSRALTIALPDTLELLAAVVDGGTATETALARVADHADPELRSALRSAIAEAGATGLGTALAAVDPALRPLGSLIRQSEELGVPVAASLRLVAADARLRARVQARERAAAAAPKMLLVVGGLLAPAALLIVIGGQVLAMRELIGPALA